MILDGETLVYDNTDRPAAGTECAFCRTSGHFCPAKGYAGETPLCEACGTGQQCSQAAAIEKMHAGIGYEEYEAATPPAECRTIAIEDADRVVVETPLAHAWKIRDELDPANLLKVKQKKRIAPKPVKVGAPKPVRETPIVAAQPKEEEAVMAEKIGLKAAKAKAQEMKDTHSISEIAAATGYSWGGVQYWLKGKPKKEEKAKTTKRDKLAVTVTVVPKQIKNCATTTLTVPEAALDRFWTRLTIAEKSRIVERELFGGL